jgi:flagellar basal-body rod modification protein FlgD
VIGDISSFGSTTTLTPPVNPKGQLGKEEFLTMLVAQLKNQDPMNPMNGDDMAAQLAQFSSLEQLTNISKQLEAQGESQAGLIGSINDTTAMGILGKNVLAASDQLEVRSGSSGDDVRFDVGGEGGLATLRIYNQAGVEVGARQLGFLSAGRHEAELGSAVDGLAPGSYHFAVEVVDTAGKVVPSQSLVYTKVDGVSYGPEGPVLTSGSVQIPFGTIIQITSD